MSLSRKPGIVWEELHRAKTCEPRFPASSPFTHHRFLMTESQHTVRALRKQPGLLILLARPLAGLGFLQVPAHLPTMDPKRRKREPEQLGEGPRHGSLEVG